MAVHAYNTIQEQNGSLTRLEQFASRFRASIAALRAYSAEAEAQDELILWQPRAN